MIYYLFKCWHGIFLLQHFYNFIVIVIRQNIFLSLPHQISHTHKLFFPKFSFESLAPSHSNYFLHLSPPKFFPLTIFPLNIFPSQSFIRVFMSSLLLILTLSHGNLSFSPHSSSLFFPSFGPICHHHPLHSHLSTTATHYTATLCYRC